MKTLGKIFVFCALVLALFGCPQEVPEPLAVESYSISPKNLEMEVGDTGRVVVSYSPANAEIGKKYSIKVSNEDIASVDSEGNITAYKAGTTTITVSSKEVSATASATLVVKEKTIPVTSIAITNTKPLSLNVGETVALAVKITPENANEGTNLSYKTSNSSVATVSDSGVVTAKAAGSATITVSSANNKTATIAVTVTAPSSGDDNPGEEGGNEEIIYDTATIIDLTKFPSGVTYEGDTGTWEGLNIDATKGKFGNNNGSWIQVNSGTIITFKVADGASASVTAYSSASNFTVSVKGTICTITATANDYLSAISIDYNGGSEGDDNTGEGGEPVVPEKNPAITLNKTSLTLIEGETETLIVTYTDIDDKKVTWSSKDASIATVDSTGKITAVKEGSTTITATYSDSVKADCAITVEKAPVSDGDDEPEVNTASIMMNGTSYDTLEKAFAAIGSSGNYDITLAKGTYSISKGLSYNGGATVKISGNTTTKYGTDVVILGRGSNMETMWGRELLIFRGKGNLVLENLTLKSDYTRAEDADGNVQAEVLGYGGTGYVAAYNCSFISHQDTLRTAGKGWFYNCYVSGDVDFIWMQGGSVALYEECEIVSVNDEVKTAYIAAPRLEKTSSVGKGVVIYNSTVKTQSGVTNYLFRNPWGSNDTLYNQAAFVNITLDGALKNTLMHSAAMGTTDQQYIGWKIDQDLAGQYSGYDSSIGIVTTDLEAKEYSGRRAILNRNYVVSDEKFQKDTESYWDIDSFITDAGWNVTTDTSKELLDGETEKVVTIYDFASVNPTSVNGLTTSGSISWNQNKYAYGKNNASLSLNVTGNCTVTVSYCYKANGTISNGTATASFATNSGSTGTIEETAFTHTAGAGTIKITLVGESYLTKIKVEYDDSLIYVPVTNVTVTGDKTEIGISDTLQLTASVSPNNATLKDVTWNSSDASVATVTEKGLVTGLKAGTAIISATSKDDSSIAGTYTVEVVAGNFDAAMATVTWNLFDSSVSFEKITGTIKGIVTGSSDYDVLLKVNATSGKLKGNGNQHAQMNEGTIISVPVTNGAVVEVTVTSAGNQYALYTIAGTAASTSTAVSSYTHAGEATYIDIVATGTAYPAKIVVSNLDVENLPN